MSRAAFLELPMHAGGALVVNLHSIHPDVALAGVGVARDDTGQSDKASAIQGPAFLYRKVQESGRGDCRLRIADCRLNIWGRRPGFGARGRRLESVDEVFAWTILDQLGFGVPQVQGGAEKFYGFF